MKRKRKQELGGEPVKHEIERQISDPVDLTESYESIRRRTSSVPPLPPSSSMHPTGSSTATEKTNNGYGLLTSRKPSSLTPLVEGDV